MSRKQSDLAFAAAAAGFADPELMAALARDEAGAPPWCETTVDIGTADHCPVFALNAVCRLRLVACVVTVGQVAPPVDEPARVVAA